MSDQQIDSKTLKLLKKNVQRARSILCPVQALEASGSHQHRAGAQASLSEPEGRVLAGLLFLIALEQVRLGGGLARLGGDRSQRALSERASAELLDLVRALYQGSRARMDASFAFALPCPELPDIEAVRSFASQIGWDSGIAGDTSLLGYVYQCFCAATRSQSLSRIETGNKSSRHQEIVAFTQVYTPAWVGDFLAANAILPQWRLTGDASCIAAGRYLVPGQAAPDAGSRRQAFALRVLDPACGAGHVLLRAYALLFAMLKCEGAAPDQAAVDALTCLAGVDIDVEALFVCALALYVQAICHLELAQVPTLALASVQNNASGCPCPLGTLARDWPPGHLLNRSYDAVIGNPPYIGRKLLDRTLKDELRRHYPLAASDICNAFLSRGLELVTPGGRLAYITQASLLYLPTYSRFRQEILAENHIQCLVETGPGVFPLQSGEKINSAMLVLAPGTSESPGVFVDLSRSRQKQDELLSALSADALVRRPASYFSGQRNCAFNYRFCQGLAALAEHGQPLGQVAEIKQGLATTDNTRFLRYWWQVPPTELGSRWLPYVKGVGAHRFWAPVQTVVDWGQDGAAIKAAVAERYPYLAGKTNWVVKNEKHYFRPGLVFSFVSARNLSVRVLPEGCIFDVGASAIFAPAEQTLALLAYLNSRLASAFAFGLNPTINFQVGDLKRLPVLPFSQEERRRLSELAEKTIAAKQECMRFTWTSWQSLPASEVQAVLGGQPLPVVYEKLARDLQRQTRHLAQLEDEIDAVILAAAAQMMPAETWQPELEALAFAQKIERRPLDVYPACRQDLAFAVLCQAIGTGIQAAGAAGQILLPLGGDLAALLFRSSPCPQELADSLSQELGMPLDRYLTDHFAAGAARRFAGSSPWQVEAQSGELLLLPAWKHASLLARSV